MLEVLTATTTVQFITLTQTPKWHSQGVTHRACAPPPEKKCCLCQRDPNNTCRMRVHALVTVLLEVSSMFNKQHSATLCMCYTGLLPQQQH